MEWGDSNVISHPFLAAKWSGMPLNEISHPFLAAKWSGVTPIRSCILTLAPFLSNKPRQSEDPVLHEKQVKFNIKSYIICTYLAAEWTRVRLALPNMKSMSKVEFVRRSLTGLHGNEHHK